MFSAAWCLPHCKCLTSMASTNYMRIGLPWVPKSMETSLLHEGAQHTSVPPSFGLGETWKLSPNHGHWKPNLAALSLQPGQSHQGCWHLLGCSQLQRPPSSLNTNIGPRSPSLQAFCDHEALAYVSWAICLFSIQTFVISCVMSILTHVCSIFSTTGPISTLSSGLVSSSLWAPHLSLHRYMWPISVFHEHLFWEPSCYWKA